MKFDAGKTIAIIYQEYLVQSQDVEFLGQNVNHLRQLGEKGLIINLQVQYWIETTRDFFDICLCTFLHRYFLSVGWPVLALIQFRFAILFATRCEVLNFVFILIIVGHLRDTQICMYICLSNIIQYVNQSRGCPRICLVCAQPLIVYYFVVSVIYFCNCNNKGLFLTGLTQIQVKTMPERRTTSNLCTSSKMEERAGSSYSDARGNFLTFNCALFCCINVYKTQRYQLLLIWVTKTIQDCHLEIVETTLYVRTTLLNQRTSSQKGRKEWA